MTCLIKNLKSTWGKFENEAFFFSSKKLFQTIFHGQKLYFPKQFQTR